MFAEDSAILKDMQIWEKFLFSNFRLSMVLYSPWSNALTEGQYFVHNHIEYVENNVFNYPHESNTGEGG